MGWLGVVGLFAGAAMAEDPPRRVGSLNYVSGDVTYVLRAEPGEPNEAEAETWLHADFNQPVCQDMTVKTGALARARVRIGPDAIQLADDTWLNMLNLTAKQIEASIPRGRIYLQLSSFEANESVELETPRGSLWVLLAGAYDIKIGSGDQPTRIVVFEGKARFVGGAADLPIAAGKEAEISGTYPAVVAAVHDWTGLDPTRSAPSASPATAPEPHSPEAATTPSAAAPPGAVDAAASAPGKAMSSASATPPVPAPSIAAAEAANAAQPPTPAPTARSAGDSAGPAAAAGKFETADAEARQKPADDFLLWVEQSNDDQPQPQQASRHVSAEATGSDALDRYGRWDTLPDSEAVWFPTSVPEDWAPYRFGHWDWIKPWGWTWVDDQPWGFAPFHYGRWVNIDGHWGWVPGAVDPHPVYAPALVAFVDAPDGTGGSGPDGGPDGGPQSGPAVGGPGPDVGWFPLGPGDDYQPWYQAGPDYVASVNAPEHRRSRDFGARGYSERGREAWRGGYFNRRYATVVSREAFADARRLDRGMMRQVGADRLEHAAVMRGAPRVVPAVMRRPAGPGEFRGEPGAESHGEGRVESHGEGRVEPHGEPRGEPHGATPAGMAAGRLRERPGGGAGREPGVAGRGGPRQQSERAGERPQQGFGRAEAERGAVSGRGGPRQESERAGERPQQGFGRAEAERGAVAGRGTATPYGRAEAARGMTPAVHGEARQAGRAQVFQTSAPGFRGGGAAQQFGRPEAAQGFRGGAAQQFAGPQASQGFRGATPQQFRQPQVSPGFRGGAPQQFARPQVSQAFRGGAPQQFARPQPAQGFHGGGQQIGRPQAFRAPAAAVRGGGMTARAAPQVAARPAPQVGGGGGRHK
jgi:hypothetical protein